MPELHLKCKGCGEIDSIVDVDLVPRMQGFTIGEDIDDRRYWGSEDEAAWEATTTVGHGCQTDDCEYVHYQYGNLEWNEEDNGWRVKRGPKVQDIADVVVEDPETGEYVAPTGPLGV